MKLQFLLLSVVMICLAACAADKPYRLPDLNGSQSLQGIDSCTRVFPKGRWQFVHAIEFSLKDGAGSTVIGVTTLTDNSIECGLMTVEGFTLFEAVSRHGQQLKVSRAVPPFDNPEFAAGLMGDIRAIFRPPVASTVRYGEVVEVPVCRHIMPDGRVVDVLSSVDDCWAIRSYTAEMEMDRSIFGRSCRKTGSNFIPENLVLQTYGQAGYTLNLKLIRADIIQ